MKKLICLIFTITLGFSAYGKTLSDTEGEKDSFTLPKWNEFKEEHIAPILDGVCIDNSSLYKLTASFMHPNVKFTKKEKKVIEDLLKTFPYSLVDNDTITYNAQNTVAIAYYKLIKGNKKKVSLLLDSCLFNFKEMFLGLPTCKKEVPLFIRNTEYELRNKLLKKTFLINKASDDIILEKWHQPSDILFDIPMCFNHDIYNLFLELLLYESQNEKEILPFLYRTIAYNRFDVGKFVLEKVFIFPKDNSERNLLLLSLLSYADIYENQEASLYFKQMFPVKYLHKYNENVKCIVSYEKSEGRISSNSTKGYDWYNLGSRIMEVSLGALNFMYTDNFVKEMTREIFGEFSDEYKLIKRDNIGPFSDLFVDDLDSMLKRELRDGDIDSITSNRIINLLNSYYRIAEYEKVIEKSKVYRNYISDLDLSNYYNLCGLSELKLGFYSESINSLEEALKYADENKSTIENNLAQALCEYGKYNEALSIYNKYINTYNPEDAYNTFYINDRLGYLYSFIDHNIALQYYLEASRIVEINNSRFNGSIGRLDDDNKIIRHYLNLSELYNDNKYLQRKCIDKANDLWSSSKSLLTLFYDSSHIDSLIVYSKADTRPDSIVIGNIYSKLGSFYNSILNFTAAETCYKSALTYFQVLSSSNRQKRLLVKNYAKNLYDSQELYQCIGLLTELRKIESEVLGKEHIDYLRTLRLLLLATIANEDISSAKQLYVEYEKIAPLHSIELNALEHHQVLYSYHNLIGNPNRTIEILENLVLSSQMDPKILTFSDELIALVSIHQSEKSEYINRVVMEKTKEIITYHFTKIYSQDRVNWQLPLYSLRSQMINTLTESNASQSIAFDFSLYSKNLLFFTQSKFDKELSRSKRNRDAISELKAMRDSLNTAISQGNYIKIKKIEGEIESKERELYHSIQLKNPYDIRIADVLSVLGEKELAVDFVQYESSEEEKKYGAFLLSHDLESPIFIELCNDDLIRNIAIDEKGNIQHDFYKNIASYELIWEKLIPYLNDYENIYFSGDGLLNQLAIEYICNELGERICENYRIHRVFHLANIKKTEGIGNNFVGIGVADHNSPINDSISTIDRGSWNNLNGIKQEFATIRKTLDAHPECKTLFIVDDDAREKQIKELDNSSVTALHIATHGFYKDKKSLWEAADDSTHFDHHISCRALGANKKSLSGLVLRQGNLSWKSATITDEYDDLLTNDEIENMTFPNLKLTVLSACDTGLGNVDSEGVWGLQRAFRIAGTKSLICSLSKISDKWTAKFMDVFYEEVTSGKNIYDAFHSAQDYLYRKNKRNPKIWASMILIE